MKNLLLILSLLLIVGLACDANDNTSNGSTSSTETSEVKNEPAIVISSKELTKAYDENELAADKKYKGKTIEVSGKVENIAETMGNVTVSLDGHNQVISVMCSFDSSETDAVSRLKKGENVTLVGKGDGYTAGLYAGLSECKVK